MTGFGRVEPDEEAVTISLERRSSERQRSVELVFDRVVCGRLLMDGLETLRCVAAIGRLADPYRSVAGRKRTVANQGLSL